MLMNEDRKTQLLGQFLQLLPVPLICVFVMLCLTQISQDQKTTHQEQDEGKCISFVNPIIDQEYGKGQTTENIVHQHIPFGQKKR